VAAIVHWPCRMNDKAQFGMRERELVLAVATRLLRDPDDAEDVAQEAMMLAFRHRATFRGEAKFTTWLYRVAVTTALMHLRQKRRRVEHVDLADVELLASGLDPEERALVEESVTQAAQRLAELGNAYRNVVRMRYAEGYSSTEVSRELGLKNATVKMRAHRGRAALRAALVSR
jgi:RNA polymerase sigma-70 factor, ECF subfamily